MDAIISDLTDITKKGTRNEKGYTLLETDIIIKATCKN